MPLQIRRGLDSEREAKVFADGEIVFSYPDTGSKDEGRLYIGDGETQGGIQVTGFTGEDAIDAVGGALEGGTHQNISFTYNSTQDLANRIDATVSLSILLEDLDLNNYKIGGSGEINLAGPITADAFNGSVFPDGSVLGGLPLVDAVDASINLNGTVKGNIVPSTNGTLDIGSGSNKFKDGYLTSLYLGSAHITASGSAVNLPAGSTMDNKSIVSLSSTGVLAYDINGSVFGDNSTMIVDGTDGTIYSNKVIADSGTLAIGYETDPSNIVLKTDNQFFTQFFGINDGSNEPIIELNVAKGTLSSMTTMQADDSVSGWTMRAYDGSAFKSVTAMVSILDSSATMSDAYPATNFGIYVAGGAAMNEYLFRSNGVLSTPVLKVASYATGSEPASPENGWIIYNSTTNKYQGYSQGVWVDLS